jgi:hypothetical protein
MVRWTHGRTLGPVSKELSSAHDPFDALDDEQRDVLMRVAEVLQRLEFGTVLLIVQDGKVVQIEMAEKFRLR